MTGLEWAALGKVIGVVGGVLLLLTYLSRNATAEPWWKIVKRNKRTGADGKPAPWGERP